jgi:isopenicillin N synthase-like dioxygenase
MEESHFADRLTGEPLTLFRIFNYPPSADQSLWGVGEHTDYGLLTILL